MRKNCTFSNILQKVKSYIFCQKVYLFFYMYFVCIIKRPIPKQKKTEVLYRSIEGRATSIFEYIIIVLHVTGGDWLVSIRLTLVAKLDPSILPLAPPPPTPPPPARQGGIHWKRTKLFLLSSYLAQSPPPPLTAACSGRYTKWRKTKRGERLVDWLVGGGCWSRIRRQRSVGLFQFILSTQQRNVPIDRVTFLVFLVVCYLYEFMSHTVSITSVTTDEPFKMQHRHGNKINSSSNRLLLSLFRISLCIQEKFGT